MLSWWLQFDVFVEICNLYVVPLFHILITILDFISFHFSISAFKCLDVSLGHLLTKIMINMSILT